MEARRDNPPIAQDMPTLPGLTVAVSRTSGVAPLGVTFSVEGLTDAQLRRAEVYWDFGPTEDYAFTSLPSRARIPRSARYARGIDTGHVFRWGDGGPTRTVTGLIYHEGAVYSLPAITITLTDPDVVFAGADTVYYDPGAADLATVKAAVVAAGGPGDLADANYQFGAAGDAWSAATGKRLLLRRGSTTTGQNLDTITDDATPTGPIHIAPWGTGARPIITHPPGASDTDTSFARIIRLGPAGFAAGVTITGVEFYGDYDESDPPLYTAAGRFEAIEIGPGGESKWITLYDLVASGLHTGLTRAGNESVTADYKIDSMLNFGMASQGGVRNAIRGCGIRRAVTARKDPDDADKTLNTPGPDNHVNNPWHGGVRYAVANRSSMGQCYIESYAGWAGIQGPVRALTEGRLDTSSVFTWNHLVGGNANIDIVVKNQQDDVLPIRWAVVEANVLEATRDTNDHVTTTYGNVVVRNNLMLQPGLTSGEYSGGSIRMVGPISNRWINSNYTVDDLGGVESYSNTVISIMERTGTFADDFGDGVAFYAESGATGDLVGTLTDYTTANNAYLLAGSSFSNKASFAAPTNMSALGVPLAGSSAIADADDARPVAALDFTGRPRPATPAARAVGALEPGATLFNTDAIPDYDPPVFTVDWTDATTPVDGDVLGTDVSLTLAISDAGSPAITASDVAVYVGSPNAPYASDYAFQPLDVFKPRADLLYHPYGSVKAEGTQGAVPASGFGAGDVVQFRGDALTGWGDKLTVGRVVTFAVGVMLPETPTFTNIIRSDDGVQLWVTSGGDMELNIRNTAGQSTGVKTLSPKVAFGQPLFIVVSIDLDEGVGADRARVWVNGVRLSGSGVALAGNMDHDGAHLAANPSGAATSDLDVNRFFWASAAHSGSSAWSDAFFDLPGVAARALPTDGSIVVGGQTFTPQVFIQGDAAAWNQGINAGSAGGALTTHGELR